MACRLRIDVLATTVLTIAVCGLTTAPFRTWLAPGNAQAQMPDPCQGVVGRWDWSINDSPATPEVTIRPDGTVVHGDRTGKWFCADSKYNVVWDHGPTDMLSLSRDGGRLSGKNNAGASVSGEKIASVLPGPGDTAMDVRPPAQPGLPPSSAPPPRSKVLGMDLAPLTDELRKKFLISSTVRGGLVVLGVDFDSPVSNKPNPGDVIVEFNHDSVSRVDEFLAAVERLRAAGRRATVLLVADPKKGELRFIGIRIPDAAAPSPPPSSPPGVAKPGTGGGSIDEFMKDFFPPQPNQPPPSMPSPPAATAPSPAPLPPAQTGEWTTGWNRMEVTATLKPLASDPKRGVLGIRNANVDFLATLLAPNLKQGAFVIAVRNDGAVAGQMHPGDIITAVDGRAVRSAPDLASLMRRRPAGAQVKIEFWRRTGGYTELRSAISRGAQANNATATYLLGVLEAIPETGEPNFRNVFNHYLRAATLGSVHGMGAVAQFYQQGRGTEKNPSEAARWLRQAVERGSALAMFHLAHLIASGQVGTANPVETFQLMERAAKGGLALAHYFVASYYDAAYGTARNPEAGARHLIEAIRHGGTEMLVRFSTEKTWHPSAEFIMALQQQLQAAKVYQGPIDGKRSPQMLTGLVKLYVESGQ